MKSVVAVCLTVFIFQNVAAGLVDRVDDQERTLDLYHSFSMKGTVSTLGVSYDFAIWVSEPKNAMRMDVVNMTGIQTDNKILFLGNEGSYGTMRAYTTLLGNERCHFVRGTALKQINVKSQFSDEELDFQDIENVNGEKIEKWVKNKGSINVEFFVKRNENGVVPLRMVFTKKSKNNLVITFHIKEYTDKPEIDDVFDYDSSSPCQEVQFPSDLEPSKSAGFSSRIFRRDVHEVEEAGPLHAMSDLVKAFVRN